ADDPARVGALSCRVDPGRHGGATCRAQGTTDRRRPHPGAAPAAVGSGARTHPERAAPKHWRDIKTPLPACLAPLNQPGPPQTLFKTLDRALADTVGHKLFTLLYVAPNKKRVKRMYTNMPKEYPVGGYKEIGATPWHKRVVEERRAWVGYNADDIKWAYFDYELILSLGCESAMNVPVVYAGR